MRADTQDQLRAVDKPKAFPVAKLLLGVAVLAGLLLFWFWGAEDDAAETVDLPAAPEKRVVPPTPDIPVRTKPAPAPAPAPSEAQVAETAPVEPALPSPAASDEMLRQRLSLAGADAPLDGLSASEHPLELSAALIDGMSRGAILRKILPATPPREPFSADVDGDTLYMNPESYGRYDSYADTVAALDSDALIESFHLMRPMYERAYAQLGLDSADFDNAIIRTLDLILATPEIEDPIPLKRDSVMYTYADSELESLPALQKQLLRMGPENIRRIKSKARALRSGLLAR